VSVVDFLQTVVLVSRIVGWREWLFGPKVTSQMGVSSPYAPNDALETFMAKDLLGELAENGIVTRQTALRVPGVKRAHGIHAAIVGRAKWTVMEGDRPAAEQPGWLTNSASGVSPYHRMFGVASDLFFNGWACIGFTADMSDAIHIPFGLWGVDRLGNVVVDGSVDAQYRARPVAIQLGYGENGILVDGADTIRAARNIERAWMDRVDNPIPATDLHITDPAFNGMTKREKRRIVDEWNENRRRAGGQTAITQSFLEVRALGQVSADLFEKGRNAVRLDLANHAAVPASIIEGAKDGGGSDINYSNDSTERNELVDFGTSRFLLAIEGRLSLDDVLPSGQSLRADLTNLMTTPSPGMNATSED